MNAQLETRKVKIGSYEDPRDVNRCVHVRPRLGFTMELGNVAFSGSDENTTRRRYNFHQPLLPHIWNAAIGPTLLPI